MKYLDNYNDYTVILFKMKKFFLLPIILFFTLLLYPSHSFADIIVIRVNGVVNPVMSEFISKNIDMADKDNAEAVVIELDTPGGLDTSMRSIVIRRMDP